MRNLLTELKKNLNIVFEVAGAKLVANYTGDALSIDRTDWRMQVSRLTLMTWGYSKIGLDKRPALW